MRETTADMAFRNANDMNVPVDIWVHPPDEDSTYWRATASNYMPRKGCLQTQAYGEKADNREELIAQIRTHVLPLYRGALKQLESICDGSCPQDDMNLYYWTSADRLVEEP